MCIIAAKPAGVRMPDDRTIETMWYSNPNGAGLMYPVTQVVKHKGKKTTTKVVQIEKGFMQLEHLMNRLEELGKSMDLTATPVVLHFRITTHGGTCPENTHPFPVTDSVGVLKKLRSTTTLGVAHNGIIHSVTPRKGISDTMEYVATQLSPLTKALPRWYDNKDALRLVENAIGSKLAVLTPEGSIHLIGKFETHDGIMYSNSSYIGSLYDKKYGFFDDDGWDWYSYADLSDEDLDPVTRYLCFLDDIPGAYGRDDDGQLLEGTDLAMANDGKVYWFDCELGYWVPTNITALTAEGTPLRYDYELASPEPTVTSRQAAAWYGLLEEDDAPFDETELPQ